MRRVVRRQPEPPREVPRWALFERVVLTVPSLAVMAIGAVLLWALWQVGGAAEPSPGALDALDAETGQPGQADGDAVPVGAPSPLAWLLRVVAVGLLALPTVTWWRQVVMLRDGILVTARVIQAEPLIRRDNVPVGTVGVRRVDHPLGEFDEPFRARPSQETPEVADVQRLLAHPRRQRVWLELGVEQP